MTPARVGGRLLHPAALFGAVWSVGLGAWLLASPEWFLEIAAAEKHVSATAMAYFVACLGAFLFGVAIGPALLRADEVPARVKPSDLTGEDLALLQRRTKIWFAVGGACAIYLLAAGTLRFGGPGALASYLSGGGSLEFLAQNYFEPSRKPGLTVWIHALVAVGPLTTVASALARERSTSRRFAALNVLGLVAVALVSIAFAERLITFGYVVASLVAWIGIRSWSPRAHTSRLGGRVWLRVSLVGFLVVGLWIAGEYSRTYLATRTSEAPVSLGDIAASVPLAAERFLAYVATSLNNGMYAVDNAEERGLILNTASVVVTSSGLERPGAPIVGAALEQRDALLWQIFPYHTPLTTFSMPGDVFQDIGWVGPFLIFWFGVAAGCIYARFRRGELWALLIYPLVVAGILDSYRLLYWTRTEMVLPVVVTVLVTMRWYRRARTAPATGGAARQSMPMVER